MSLTLAEQYLAEAFPQSWLARVEVSELPVQSITLEEFDADGDYYPGEESNS